MKIGDRSPNPPHQRYATRRAPYLIDLRELLCFLEWTRTGSHTERLLIFETGHTGSNEHVLSCLFMCFQEGRELQPHRAW